MLINLRQRKSRLYVIAQCIGLALILLALPKPAFAYLDPGTGSMIIQLVVGAIAGALIVGRSYLYMIMEKLGLRKKKPESETEKSE